MAKSRQYTCKVGDQYSLRVRSPRTFITSLQKRTPRKSITDRQKFARENFRKAMLYAKTKANKNKARLEVQGNRD